MFATMSLEQKIIFLKNNNFTNLKQEIRNLNYSIKNIKISNDGIFIFVCKDQA